VTPRLTNLDKGQGGCVYCAGRARIDPEAAAAVMRAADLEPLEPYPGSGVAWRCTHLPCGREVRTRYSWIRKGNRACLHCRVSAPVTAEQAAAELRAAGMEPTAPFAGLDSKWPALCLTCGSPGAPRLGLIRRGQGGCIPCGRKKANASLRHDAAAAEAAMRRAGLEPLMPYPGTAKPWRSRCTRCGAEVAPRLMNIDRVVPCRRCADRARGIAQRHDEDLAVEEMRAHGFEPLEPYRGVKQPWLCHCTGCGGTTSPTFGSILAGQSGCRRCADLRAAAARREDPEAAAASMREAGLEPLELYQTSMTPWRCRCRTCGRTSTPLLAKIRSGHGCRYCATHGFQRGAPARVYVVTHALLGAVKIGVAGASRRNDRIDQHRRLGWALAYEHRVPTGDDALAIEQHILRTLRDAGNPVYLSPEELPNGWSETFDADSVTAYQLQQMIKSQAASRSQKALPAPEPLTMTLF
jgi:hypothetical protein